jgi:hypothetical protein|tara:strand:- start:720 stop:980 length:261 start_codon:yes stop_codon:yes gene_type:complete
MALANNGAITENIASTSYGTAQLNVGNGTATNVSTISTTTYANKQIEVDISTLANGTYEVEFELKSQNSTSTAVVTNVVVEVAREV